MFVIYVGVNLQTIKLASGKLKLILWYILTTFPHKHGCFALSVDVYKKIHQN